MPRIQFIELHDQHWFPRNWRDTLTSFLRFMAAKTGNAAQVAPAVAEVVQRHGATRIVDLCAGGGGPTPSVLAALESMGMKVDVTLTDLHPNLGAFERMQLESSGRIQFEKESVDATAVPARLSGVRTIFNAFHHFPPPLATQILAAARRDRQPIVVVELVGRTVPMVIAMCFTGIFQLLVTPFLRPVHLSSIVFTYLIPVLPLVTMFDGIVSALRVYSPQELEGLVAGEQAADWKWSTKIVPLGGPAFATVFVGEPVEAGK